MGTWWWVGATWRCWWAPWSWVLVMISVSIGNLLWGLGLGGGNLGVLVGTLVLGFGYDLCEYWQLDVGPGVGWGNLGVLVDKYMVVWCMLR